MHCEITACLLLFAAPLSAQVNKVLPASAGLEGTTATPMVGSYGEGRIQQVVDGAALCNTRATLRAIALRADGWALRKLAAKSLAKFKLALGYTSVTPQTMQTTFANNRTGAQTVVFSGTLALPAQDDKTRPFNIVLRFSKLFVYERSKGNLLIELEQPKQGAVAEYPFDAHVQSTSVGSWTPFGPAGTLNASAQPRVSCEAEYLLRPGRQAVSLISALRKQYPAAIAWGFSDRQWGPFQLPLALGAAAPGNAVNVSLDVILPLTILQSGNTFYGRSVLPLPNSNAVLGAKLFTQVILVDGASNQLGLVLTQGLAMHVQAAVQSPMQYVQIRDTNSATGFRGNSGESLVVEFQGVFQ